MVSILEYKMNILVLHASPRKKGNTAALVDIFTDEVQSFGANVKTLYLYDMEIKPCKACCECQKDWTKPACVRNDDLQSVFEEVLKADLIVLASPIYIWYCTAPMKAALDRMAYAMNKYYGDEWGPSLWKGKSVAIITTCGYSVEKGTDLWEEGVKRYCKHSELRYIGMTAQRHKSYKEKFMNDDIEAETRAFARFLLNEY